MSPPRKTATQPELGLGRRWLPQALAALAGGIATLSDADGPQPPHAGSHAFGAAQAGSQQAGAGQHTVTGTCLHTTRGTHRVTVYGTCFGTIRTQWTVFV